jgi:salicylate hydroxylase
MRIAIVGAGIAGLTVAAALTSAGLDCEVFEQADRFAEVGAGIQLAPNATRLLLRLGLGRFLSQAAVRPAAIEMRRWEDNSLLRRTPLGDASEQEFGAPYYTVHRSDLHAGLLGLLDPGLVHLGARVRAIEEHPSDVRLHFQDGSVARADVVIGADGIHSAVRAVFSSDQPRFSGHSIYRGLVPANRIGTLLGEPRVLLWLGPARHCVCYPVRNGRLISVGATTPAPGWHLESWTAAGSKEQLIAQYAGWNDQVTALLAALPAVSQWALHDRDDIDRWSRPNITLAGDAAHPMLPFLAQGANQAIEDAIVLAAVLRDATKNDIADALARYEHVRRERTREVHRVSRGNTDMLHLPDGAAQAERDRKLGESADPRSQAWLYGYQAERAVETAPENVCAQLAGGW